MKKKTMKCEFVLVFLFLLIFGMVPVLLADSGVNQYLPDQLHVHLSEGNHTELSGGHIQWKCQVHTKTEKIL